MLHALETPQRITVPQNPKCSGSDEQLDPATLQLQMESSGQASSRLLNHEL
ncbi:hypothetical protein D9M72_609320 [compost metagenome]